MYIFKLMDIIHGELGTIAQRHVDQVLELVLKMCAYLTNMEAYHAQRQLLLQGKPNHASL